MNSLEFRKEKSDEICMRQNKYLMRRERTRGRYMIRKGTAAVSVAQRFEETGFISFA